MSTLSYDNEMPDYRLACNFHILLRKTAVVGTTKESWYGVALVDKKEFQEVSSTNCSYLYDL